MQKECSKILIKNLFAVIININLYSTTWSKTFRILYDIKDCHLEIR